jgi:8-amino-7-oxononanoate synthase
MTKTAPYQAYCEQRLAAHQFRQLQPSQILPDGHVRRNDADLLNFASNDYLDLSQHPELIKRANEALTAFGTGTTASRLITGNHPLYETIETKLAKGKGTETALVMASGYQANLTVLAALADSTVIGKPVAILADRLSHNSLLQGGLLSSALGDTKLLRFNHNDYAHLQTLLQQQADKNAHCIIVTESVFGMDGDCADLGMLTVLAKQFDAMLYVDEAHATGLYGPNGFGLCATHKGNIDIAMGTFGKALGTFGAYIACNRTIRDYLLQRCGGLIYSTALPPAVLGAIDAALDLLPRMEKERVYIAAQSKRLRETLQNQGWNCGASTTHIVPIILGGEEAATSLAETLLQNGILAPAIRPPTVPRGTSRLRISLSAAHNEKAIDQLIAVLSTQSKSFAKAA